MDAKTRTLFCLPPCRCSAQPSLGLRITPFSPRSLWRSLPSLFSAPQAPAPALTWTKTLPSSASRPGQASKTMTCFAGRSSRPSFVESGEVDVGVLRS